MILALSLKLLQQLLHKLREGIIYILEGMTLDDRKRLFFCAAIMSLSLVT